MNTQSHTSAPVHEYRCLFTRDLHKKQKKWHDGTLKFHTYNSRVMVYDDGRNFVGDLHYRDAEEFGEGLEIQLDKPVLVNVEDLLGESSTDLTSIVRQRQEGPASSSHSANLSRSKVVTSQTKAKSIKELLGASRGQLGRARLPSQSPFDLYRLETQAQLAEPPNKRQKTDEGKENVPPVPSRSKTTKATAALRTSELRAKTAPETAEHVVDISSDEGHGKMMSPSPPIQSSISKQRVRSAKRSHPLREDQLRKPGVSKSDINSVRASARTQKSTSDGCNGSLPQETNSITVQKLQPAPDITHDSASAAGSKRRISGPTSFLTFAAPKLRPKLRYKALLPSSASSREVYNGQARQTLKAPSPKHSPLPMGRPALLEIDQLMDRPVSSQERLALNLQVQRNSSGDKDAVQSFHQVQQEKYDSPPANRQCDVSQDEEFERIHIDSSPLFVPHTPTQQSGRPTHFSLRGDFVIPEEEQNGIVVAGQTGSPRDNVQEDVAQSMARHRLNRPFVDDEYEDENENDDDDVDEIVEIPNEEEQSCQTTSVEEDQNIVGSAEQTSANLLDNDFTCLPVIDISVGGEDVNEHFPGHTELPSKALGTLRTPRRAFRRVLSESNAENRSVVNSATQGSPQTAEMPPPRHALPQVKGSPKPVTTAIPTHLARSASDSAVLNELEISSTALDAFLSDVSQFRPPELPIKPQLQLPTDEEDATDSMGDNIPEQPDEQGPWTGIEAFLLFERWPPNHVKPSYGAHDKDIDPPIDTRRVGTKLKIANAATARSAEPSIGLGKKGKYSKFSSARLVSQR